MDIENLLNQLNEKAKSNGYIVEIGVETIDSNKINTFCKRYKDLFQKFNSLNYNIVTFLPREETINPREETINKELSDYYRVMFSFYNRENYLQQWEMETIDMMDVCIEFDNFEEFETKLEFLIKNLK